MNDKLGVQLYAFARETLDTSLESILEALSEMGFEAVEGAPGHEVVYRDRLDALGMHYIAPHVATSKLERMEEIVAYLQRMRAVDVCCSGLIESEKRTLENYARTCEYLNQKGKDLKNAGIHLHYHNHSFEFEAIDERRSGIDVLLVGLDFEAVDLCTDVGWIWRAGVDPADFLAEHASRIGYVHLRDFAGETSVALGEGDIDLCSIMGSVTRLPSLRWLVVEHDPVSADPLLALRVSRDYLRRQFAV
jgi:sugar phosphate isomerase/epimerase